jgi:hypothetical protein
LLVLLMVLLYFSEQRLSLLAQLFDFPVQQFKPITQSAIYPRKHDLSNLLSSELLGGISW